MFVVCEGFIITFRSYTAELPVYTLHTYVIVRSVDIDQMKRMVVLRDLERCHFLRLPKLFFVRNNPANTIQCACPHNCLCWRQNNKAQRHKKKEKHRLHTKEDLVNSFTSDDAASESIDDDCLCNEPNCRDSSILSEQTLEYSEDEYAVYEHGLK